MPRAYDARDGERSVFDALLEARERSGAKKPILEDQDRNPLSYTDLIRASFALGRRIASFTEKGERVGVLLPSGSGVVVTFFGLHAFGRIPTMLNFTSGLRNLRAACKLAGVKRVLTAHRFIEQGKLHDLVDALEESAEVIYLEDVREKIGLADKLYAATAGMFPKRFRANLKPDEPGVILFTSGSFGAPRGVVLSHGNLVSNVRQIEAHIDLDPDWVMFNPLPTFHCFGLTGGVLLPILTGMKAFEYPSPLHIKQIPPLIKDSGASILLATDTFLNQYARSSDADELSGLKFIVCGAEKVRDETHNLIAERFGNIPVLEGYGATEASPVVAVNKPVDNRRGTVGGMLPGMETRIEPVEGIKDLVTQGEKRIRNGMAGYIWLSKEGGREHVALPDALQSSMRDVGYTLLLKRIRQDVENATDEEIHAAALSTIPNVPALFWSFRIMVGLGFYFILLFGASFYFSCKRRHGPLWFMKLSVMSLPLPWIAAELGWVVAEYGRQPWIIDGIMPTFMGVSDVPASDVVASLAAFVLFYSSLAVVDLMLIIKYVRIGPHANGPAPTMAGALPAPQPTSDASR